MDKVEDVHKLLNGPCGSKVRLKLSRSGVQFDATLVRAEDSSGKKPAQARPAPSKPVEPAGKKKLTDRERADRCSRAPLRRATMCCRRSAPRKVDPQGANDSRFDSLHASCVCDERMLNGGVKYRGGDHNTTMERASDAEAAQINAAERERHAMAQKDADKLYDDNIRRDEEAKEAAKAAKAAQGSSWQQQLGNMGGLFGGNLKAQEANKRKQVWGFCAGSAFGGGGGGVCNLVFYRGVGCDVRGRGELCASFRGLRR